MTATSPRSWDKLGRIVRIGVGLLLLASAGLKLDDLLYGQASALLWLPSPRWVFAAIEVETLIGLWLLSNWQPRLAWLASISLLIILSAIALTLALQGQSSCGCFGRVSTQVSPWGMFLLDVVVLVATAIVRPGVESVGAWPVIRPMAASVAVITVILSCVGFTMDWIGYDPYRVLTRLRGETLLIEPYIVDIGSGPPGEIRKVTVSVRNQGTQPARVVGGTSTCACITSDDLPVVIEPGQALPITIRIKFSGPVGRFQQRYTLLWADGQLHNRISARIAGEVLSRERLPVDAGRL